MWKTLCAASAAWFLATGSLSAATPDVKTEVKMERQSLNLTQEWDKVFPLSSKVNHRKVTFINRYGITLAADMYVPKQAEGKLPAIAVSGTALRSFARHQYGRFLCGGGFSVHLRPGGCRPYRYFGYLRMGRHGSQCGSH